VIVATGLTLLLGFAVGVWASEAPRVERILRPILDAMQTLPQFVYLVPVVALFNVGRVPGVIASVLYAMPVVIRLVTAGLRDVSATAVEAASSFGASRMQLLMKVRSRSPARRSCLASTRHRDGARVVIVRGSWAVARSATEWWSGSSATHLATELSRVSHFVSRHRLRSHHADRRARGARRSLVRFARSAAS